MMCGLGTRAQSRLLRRISAQSGKGVLCLALVGRRERLRLAEWQRLGVYGREGGPAGMRSVRFSLAIAAGAEMEVNGCGHRAALGRPEKEGFPRRDSCLTCDSRRCFSQL